VLSLLQVEILCLPKNCTATHQQMDQGIIESLKAGYRRRLAAAVVRNLGNWDELRSQAKALISSKALQEGQVGLKYAHPPHLLDAAELAAAAWESVTPATIANCAYKAKLWPDEMAKELQAKHVDRQRDRVTKTELDDLCQTMMTLVMSEKRGGLLDELGELRELVRPLIVGGHTPSGEVIKATMEKWIGVEEDPKVKEDEVTLELEEISSRVRDALTVDDDSDMEMKEIVEQMEEEQHTKSGPAPVVKLPENVEQRLVELRDLFVHSQFPEVAVPLADAVLLYKQRRTEAAKQTSLGDFFTVTMKPKTKSSSSSSSSSGMT
jgi:hypothetical protein